MEIDQILLEEIRENRSEIKNLKQELSLFKIKAFGFMTAVSIILNISLDRFL